MTASPGRGIFISYRREDSSGHSGRLYDALKGRFGEQRVFMDIDAIKPGQNFVEVIRTAVGSCDVLIAVIGDQWLSCCTDGGTRRLDDPEDFVRSEIAAALERGIPVIPVLVEGAAMPRPQDLPDALRKLAHQNALELSDSRWPHDVGRLVATIKGITGERRPSRRFTGSALRAGGALAAVIVGLLALALYLAAGRPATIRGFVWTGSPEAPGDPAVGASVKLVGEHPAETTIGDGGFFSFRDVRISDPRLVFEMSGHKPTAPQNVARDGKYYLRLPPKPQWKRVKDEDLTLERPPGGGSLYALTPRIQRASEPPEYDGLDLIVSLKGSAVFDGMPDVAAEIVMEDSPVDPKKAGWTLRMEDSTAIAPTITMKVRGAPLTKQQVDVEYQFRAIPSRLGGR